MKTKGALIWEFNQPWSIEEIEIGDPVKDEVKIQMEASGMCHSDHHLVTGGHPDGRLPGARRPRGRGHRHRGRTRRRGHRAGRPRGAVVHPVVRQMSDLSGRHAQPLRPRCWTCSAAPPSPTAPTGSRPRARTSIPMTLLGTFSPYMVVHKSSVVKIDPSIPFEVACLVGCGVTTGYGSATRTADIRPGEDVAIIGVGGVGHVGAAGCGQRRRPQHLRHRARRVEARPGAEVRCHACLSGHRRRNGGHRRGHRGPDGQEGRSSPSASCTARTSTAT